MAGLDENVTLTGDWVPPSSSPRALFPGMLGDEISSKMIRELPRENKMEGFVLGSQREKVKFNQDNNQKEAVQTNGGQLSILGSKTEQKSSLVERMAARSGFNAPKLNTENIRSADVSLNLEIQSSSYVTIPPGLSPTTLLESPVFLSNSLAQPSPTTGKIPFMQNTNIKGSMSLPEFHDDGKGNTYEDVGASSFAFKTVPESDSLFYFGARSEMTSNTIMPRSYTGIGVPARENIFQSHGSELPKVQSHTKNFVHCSSDLSKPVVGKDSIGDSVRLDQMEMEAFGGNAKHSPPLEEHPDDGGQRTSGDSMAPGGGTLAEDGYNWRKYGQKQVKGSEYPRSYYKCTHPNCPVKKKVERSHEGHITEIIYKGAHNHPKPPPNRRAGIASTNPLMDLQLDAAEQTLPLIGSDNDPLWANTPDNVEVTSKASLEPEVGNPLSLVKAHNGTNLDAVDTVDVSSTFSNDDDDDDRATHGSVGYEGEDDELESKRRKIEIYSSEMGGANRAIREPRVVVQTTSEVDILDDGYRWRKYGQKVVKGNPNPRSYYKCTSAGCTVRKHVERASHDLKSVITTYEGKHNHEVPAARNSSHANSGNSSTMPYHTANVGQAHVQRPESSQSMARFDRSTAFGSFGLSGRQQLGPAPSFSFGMNQPGLANLTMAGLGPGQPKMPVMPVHPYIGPQRPMNEMGFMLPKGELKVEPMTEPTINLANNASVYQQIMSKLPLGHQM